MKCQIYDTNIYSPNEFNSIAVIINSHCQGFDFINVVCLFRFKLDVTITPGTHSSESALNKQLADKERVDAALENPHLMAAVNKCIAGI